MKKTKQTRIIYKWDDHKFGITEATLCDGKLTDFRMCKSCSLPTICETDVVFLKELHKVLGELLGEIASGDEVEERKEEVTNTFLKFKPSIEHLTEEEGKKKGIISRAALEHYRDQTIGLYATDKPIGDLLHLFWSRNQDIINIMPKKQQEEQEKDFSKWVKNISFKL